MGLSQAYALDFDFSAQVYSEKSPLFGPIRAGTTITSQPDASKPSQGAVLRARLSNGKLALFQVRMAKETTDSLYSFRSPTQDSWALLTESSFFTTRPDSTTPEIQNLIWKDGILLIEEPCDTLYAKRSGEVIALARSEFFPVTVNIQTDPINAQVVVQGAPIGATPLTFQGFEGRWIWIHIEKTGYFSYEDIIEADPKTPTTIQVKLRERPYFQDGSRADSTGYDAHQSKDYQQVSNLLAHLTSSEITLERQNAIEMIHEYLDTLRNRENVEYIPTENLSVSAWDNAQHGVPVHFWYGENGFDFGFEGVIPCNQEEAFAFSELLKSHQRDSTLKVSQRPRRASWPSAHATASLDGFVRLKYRNWTTEARSNSRNVRRYFATDAIELVLPGRDIPVPGTFLPAAYIRQSPVWRSFTGQKP